MAPADWLKAIFTSPMFWTALLALVNVILKLVWTGYTDTLWLAVSGFIIAILASLGITGVESVPAKARRYRAEREARQNVGSRGPVGR